MANLIKEHKYLGSLDALFHLKILADLFWYLLDAFELRSYT